MQTPFTRVAITIACALILGGPLAGSRASAVGPQNPSLTLDQSQPAYDLGNTWAIGGFYNQFLAQTFTAGISGRLREIMVPIACDSGRLTVGIWDVDGSGLPGSPLYAETYRASYFDPFVAGEFSSAVLRLAPGLDIRAGTMYALVFSNPDAPTGSCGMIKGAADSDHYLPGKAYARDDVNSGWVPTATEGRDDLVFAIYVKS